MTSSINKYLHTTSTVPILTPLHLCFLFLHHVTISISANLAEPPYTPPDLILLNCGTSTNTNDLNGRNWTGDIDSKFSRLEQHNNPSITSKAPTQNPSVDKVPYTTARLSTSEFTYTLPVTFGPKFIRLYFYPVQYANFDRSKSFFSVKAGPHTLLSNFSASLSADAYKHDTVFREFIVNVEQNQSLNITFTPSPANPDAYAFINGIEVVSMPADLYYTRDDVEGFMFIGQGIFRIEKTTSLETVYRLNVGGNDITPVKDTGMFRIWSRDDDYVTDRRPSALPVNIDNVNLNLKLLISPYAAPLEVYNTARTMGPDGTINKSYNLTWEFPVDSQFNYFIRLHFCEFEREVTKEKDRVFQIFVANQTAEHRADVISWTGAKGVPIYKDYAVLMGREGSEKKRNLTIALHPQTQWTYYPDAILNGLELFKVSNYYDLSGPNPDPRPATPPPTVSPSRPSTKPKENRTTTIVAVSGGVVSGLLALSLTGFLIFWRGMRVKGPGSSHKTSSWGPSYYCTTKTTKTGGSSLPSDLCRHFSLAEIKAATNNFDEVFTIGVGGFGNVYKGFIDNGATPVAIKRLKPGSQQGAQEFMTEIEMLSQLRHLHLVSLIGYCNDDREMILVYDYMARGTLRDHLYNTDNPLLSWKQRLEICIGAARGLHYLHTGAKHTIIHRDVKTTNILLDEKWVAKVSDFGLSRMGPTSISKAHVSTVVKGSIGYLDPEYYRRQQLTEKSDVYSFGVVLCEVLCGRPPLNRMVDKKQVYLAEWARECYSNGTLDQIVDSYLKGKIAAECLKKFGEIAVCSLLDDGTERPSMRDVVWGLEFALQLQESAEEEDIEMKNEEEVAFIARPIDDTDEAFTGSDGNTLNSKSSGITNTSSSGDISHASKDSDKLKAGAVFSEIMDPKAR